MGCPTPSPSSAWRTHWSWASTAEKPCWPGMLASATVLGKVSRLTSSGCDVLKRERCDMVTCSTVRGVFFNLTFDPFTCFGTTSCGRRKQTSAGIKN